MLILHLPFRMSLVGAKSAPNSVMRSALVAVWSLLKTTQYLILSKSDHDPTLILDQSWPRQQFSSRPSIDHVNSRRSRIFHLQSAIGEA